jgi:2OG-Fe(II) oxygenase superfamily
MSHPDFVEVYDNALDAARCRELIDRFDRSGQARRGETGGGVEVSLKNSWDIPLHLSPGWADVVQMLNDRVLEAFKRYLRRYAHAALAPMRLQVKHPVTGALTTLDAEGVAALDEPTLNSIVMMLFRPGTINLQKYIADQGGYPYWHCESYPQLDQGEALHRVVLWTIYLNDNFGAGETEFLYQGKKIVPKAGSLLIAPTAFTHTHRGNMPTRGDKYIATSWILFQRAERLNAGRVDAGAPP